MKKVAWYAILVFATITVLLLLWQLRIAFVLFLLSLAVAAAFRPLVGALVRRGLPHSLALLLPYLSVIAILAGLIFVVSGPLIQDFQQLSNNFAITYERITSVWPERGTALERAIAERLPPTEELYSSLIGEQGEVMIQTLLGITASLFTFLSNLAIILILSLYWSADRVHFERLWLSLIPGENRTHAREIWHSIEDGVGNYIQSKFVQILLAGGLLWVGYQGMGLEYPVLLALLGALTRLIPWLGPVLAIMPPLFLGLGTSPELGAIAAFYTLLILIALEGIIEPRYFPRQSYSSVILVLVAIAFADAFGLIGLILAPPLATAIQILINNLASTNGRVEEDRSESIVILQNLRERLIKTQDILAVSKDQTAPEIASLMERVSQLVEKTDRYLTEEATLNR